MGVSGEETERPFNYTSFVRFTSAYVFHNICVRREQRYQSTRREGLRGEADNEEREGKRSYERYDEKRRENGKNRAKCVARGTSHNDDFRGEVFQGDGGGERSCRAGGLIAAGHAAAMCEENASVASRRVARENVCTDARSLSPLFSPCNIEYRKHEYIHETTVGAVARNCVAHAPSVCNARSGAIKCI